MKNTLLTLLLLLGTTAFAQNTKLKLDSLHQVWLDEGQPDTVRYQAYKEFIVKGYLNVEPDTALILAQRLYNLSLEKENKEWQSMALSMKGMSCHDLGDFSGAIKYHAKSLKLRDEIGEINAISACLNNLGLAYSEIGNNLKAIELYEKSLVIAKEMGDKKKISLILNNIGIIYMNQGAKDKALDYYVQSLEIAKELGHKVGVAMALNNIGSIYSDSDELDKAINYFLECQKICNEIDSKTGISLSLINIGQVYKRQGRFNKALDYYNQGLIIQKGIGDKNGIASTLHGIGNLYFEQKKDSAKTFAEQSLAIAWEIGSPEQISQAAELLYLIYENQKDFKALEMHKLHIQMRDSIKSEEVTKQIAQQESRAEFEKELLIKEQEEEKAALATAVELERRNSLEYSGIAFALLVLFGLVFVLGHFSLPKWLVEFSVFLPILVLFEFVLVLTDPFVDAYTGGDPMIKLLINAVFAGFIFPLHGFFESFMKKRLIKTA